MIEIDKKIKQMTMEDVTKIKINEIATHKIIACMKWKSDYNKIILNVINLYNFNFETSRKDGHGENKGRGEEKGKSLDSFPFFDERGYIKGVFYVDRRSGRR